jgi:acyl-[acyl-carrier-protein] desaturase
VEEVGDQAHSALVGFIAVDERAHHTFYRRVVELFLQFDRPGTLEQLRRVLHGFAMPAVHLLADSRRRMSQIKCLQIFKEATYMRQVCEPVLTGLGLTRRDLARTRPPCGERFGSHVPPRGSEGTGKDTLPYERITP